MASTKFDFLIEAQSVMLEPQLVAFVTQVAKAIGENPVEVIKTYSDFLDSVFRNRWWVGLDRKEIVKVKRIRQYFHGKKPRVKDYLYYVVNDES